MTMEYGEQSLSITRLMGLMKQVVNVLINLGWPYIAHKQLEAARQAIQEAQGIWRALGNIPGLLETYGALELILFTSGDHVGQLAASAESLRLNRSIGNRSIQSMALVFTSAVQTIQGQFGQALTNIKAALP